MSIILTPTSVINKWKIGGYKRSFDLKLIGKTPEVKKSKSRLMVLWLTNGDKIYRMTAFNDAISAHHDKFVLNSTIHFFSVYISKHYDDPNEPKHKDLHVGFQFNLHKYSIIEILERGSFMEYPTENVFPPFWRTLPEVRINDIFLAMRVKALTVPIKASLQSDDTKGVEIMIADKSNKKACLFVECDPQKEEDKLFVEEVKEGVEMIFFAGEFFAKDGYSAIKVFSHEYVAVMEDKKLDDINPPYEFVLAKGLLTERTTDTAFGEPPNKKKRSEVFYS